MNRDIFKILAQLKDEIASHVLLSKAERLHIFDAIDRAAQNQTKGQYAHEAAEHAPILSPYAKSTKRKHTLGTHIFFMNYASVALAICLVVAGGVSFAAEQSLPGDPLYLVKTNFNENTRSIFTFSAESKAKLEASFAEERLVELQKLVVNNKLTEENQQTINDNFIKHTEQFAKNVAEVKEKENPAAAASISRDFQTKLRAHKNVINTLAVADNTINEPVNDVSTIAMSDSGSQGGTQDQGDQPAQEPTLMAMKSLISSDEPIVGFSENPDTQDTPKDTPNDITSVTDTDDMGVTGNDILVKEVVENPTHNVSVSAAQVTESVNKQIATLDLLRIEAEAKLTALTEEEVVRETKHLAIEAETSINKLETILDSITTSSSLIRLSVETYIIDAHAALEQGYTLYDKKSYVDAYIAFQDALSAMQEAALTITNAEDLKLDQKITEGLLKSIISKKDNTAADLLDLSIPQELKDLETIKNNAQ